MLGDALGIAALARRLQAALVDVRGENLDLGSFLERCRMLAAAGSRSNRLPRRKRSRQRRRAPARRCSLPSKSFGTTSRPSVSKASESRKNWVTPISRSLKSRSASSGRCSRTWIYCSTFSICSAFHAAFQPPRDRALLVLAEIMTGSGAGAGDGSCRAAGRSARARLRLAVRARPGERHTR